MARSATSQCTVVFTPSGRRGEVEHGTTVLDAARQLGVDLDTICSGRGLCGRCQIAPSVGSFPKWNLSVDAGAFSPPGLLETDYHGRRPLAQGRRLGCATRILADAVIDVPAESQIHRQVVRKGVALDELTVDPMVTLHYVEVAAEADDLHAASAFDRINAAFADQWHASLSDAHVTVLPWLHAALDQHGGALTFAARDNRMVAVWPGFVDQIAGVAIDLGSTTIAGHLVDLSTGAVLASDGRMNPQIRFGEDLMSRVSYAMMNPGGATALTAAVQFELDALVTALLEEADVDRTQVLDIVLVGNPVMHHLALGIDPSPLGQAPFPLATAQPIEATAAAIGVRCAWAQLWVAPCIAGHVGGDMAAAILAEGPHRNDNVQLLIDVGTNAELVLGNRDGLWAASSPTGPAFEGAQLSSGQRATAGAIERVRIDPVTLEPRFKVIGIEAWSDEPWFAAAAEHLHITGICGSGVIEVIAELFLAGVVDHQGVITQAASQRSPRVVPDGRTYAYVLVDAPTPIRITQADVRAIQLAKAALRAGTELLMARSGIDTIDEIRLAGAFGAHIDPLHAMVLGLIPDAPLDAVRAVGNAAGSGAVRALVSRQQRVEMAQVAARVHKIETATEAEFQARFVEALAIPHRTAPSPHLGAVVALPQGVADAPTRRGGRRARTEKETT